MFRKIRCGACKGTGQDGKWKEHRDNKPQYIITDCAICHATGKINLEIIDKRTNKKKEPYYPIEY